MHFRWFRGFVVLALLATSCVATPAVVRTDTMAAAGEAGTSSVAPMLRDDAIQLLMDDASLPARTAGCVIDAVFLDIGDYDPNSDGAQEAMAQGNLIVVCTEGIAKANQSDDDEFVAQVDAGTRQGPDEAAQAPPFELTETSMPAVSPGGLATGTVDIGAKTIEYVTVTPPGFQIGDTAPVFFAFPPGGQDLTITRNVVDVVYRNQALSRGWVVVSPASPDGRWFDDDNTALVPELMSWMRAWVDIENGRPHIGGMSNGGLSAFHIALQAPSQFQSLLAFPGYPGNDADRALLVGLADMPVRMWVGGEDLTWRSNMETTQTTLADAGGDARLWVLPGEPHVLGSTQDGVAFFDQLDEARLS